VAASFAGLDLLATAVVVLDDDFVVRYANPAAENLFTAGARSLIGQPFLGLFAEDAELERSLEEARVIHWDYSARNVTYVRTGREPVPLSCTVTRIDAFGLGLLAELRPIEHELRLVDPSVAGDRHGGRVRVVLDQGIDRVADLNRDQAAHAQHFVLDLAQLAIEHLAAGVVLGSRRQALGFGRQSGFACPSVAGVLVAHGWAS